MGFLWKKKDPLMARARALNTEIEALEAQIRRLSDEQNGHGPELKIRSTTHPSGQTRLVQPTHSGPVFESIDHKRIQSEGESAATPAHYNSLGVRKYDLAAAWNKLLYHFRGPPTSNPKLVSYLAAGNIQGLRPLRYEKRVARNRFFLLAAILLAILSGIVSVLKSR